MSFDRLIERIAKTQNPTVVGLDPTLDFIPNNIKNKAFAKHGETLKGAAAAVYRYNKLIIDGIADIVPAIKPQSAFYEALGYHGVKTFYKTIQYAKKKGLFVIADGKRNDIGSTVAQYANAYLGTTKVGMSEFEAFGADALTVNGYEGTDGIAPLVDNCKKYDKGIFVLVKTSNPSSGELQDLKIGEREVYSVMGELCTKWGEDNIGKYGYSAVGVVVGATYPEQLTQMREQLKTSVILIPGYGAQGGGARDVAPGFDKNGCGAIVNASRSIITAWKADGAPSNASEAAREAALLMKSEIMSEIGEIVL